MGLEMGASILSQGVWWYKIYLFRAEVRVGVEKTWSESNLVLQQDTINQMLEGLWNMY